jgi:TFIIB zinc-binding
MASFITSQLIPTVPERPKIDLNYTLVCKDCKVTPPNIVEDFSAGDLVCGDCGLILGNRSMASLTQSLIPAQSGELLQTLTTAAVILVV